MAGGYDAEIDGVVLFSGSTTANVVPLPTVLLTSMRP